MLQDIEKMKVQYLMSLSFDWSLVEKKEFIVLADLNCDLLPETISKSKHLVHISGYNTYGLTQVIKEATRTTAETNTLTYYIVTNKKDNVADSGIIPCGIGDHDLVYQACQAS